MTTISTSTPILKNSDGINKSGGNDLPAQIAQITQKITNLLKQLKDIPESNCSKEEKKKQQELLQAQIKMLQAQLAQLQRQHTEEKQKKQENKQQVDAIPDGLKIDVYI